MWQSHDDYFPDRDDELEPPLERLELLDELEPLERLDELEPEYDLPEGVLEPLLIVFPEGVVDLPVVEVPFAGAGAFLAAGELTGTLVPLKALEGTVFPLYVLPLAVL
jgi:hypothetical protein